MSKAEDHEVEELAVGNLATSLHAPTVIVARPRRLPLVSPFDLCSVACVVYLSCQRDMFAICEASPTAHQAPSQTTSCVMHSVRGITYSVPGSLVGTVCHHDAVVFPHPRRPLLLFRTRTHKHAYGLCMVRGLSSVYRHCCVYRVVSAAVLSYPRA